KRDAAHVAEVHGDLKANKRALTWEFNSTDDFRQKFRHHLELWLQRWNGVPAICQFTLENIPTLKSKDHLGEVRLSRLEQAFALSRLKPIESYLGAEAVARYQNQEAPQPLSAKTLGSLDPSWQSAAAASEGAHQGTPKPLVRQANGNVDYGDREWFCY